MLHKPPNLLSKMTRGPKRMFSVRLLRTIQSHIAISNELTRKETHLATENSSDILFWLPDAFSQYRGDGYNDPD